jgi:hypothetical protein
MPLIKILFYHRTKVFIIFKSICFFPKSLFFNLGKAHQDDPRLHNLYYRKSKLESISETSALLSGFAIVCLLIKKRNNLIPSCSIIFHIGSYC